MPEILKLMQDRKSSRMPFDPERPLSKKDLEQILEAARWAPTAHNMQNFEIVVVDDRKLLKALSDIKSPMTETFIRENYQQLSFSEEELLRKKVGILGTTFPPALRKPEVKLDTNMREKTASFQERLIQKSSALLVATFDPGKRAPDSEGDFLGAVSLGCMLENMWLMAGSLGIGFHVVSALSDYPAEKEVKGLLDIPQNLKIAFTARLGYPAAAPSKYLRVRRDIQDFAHHNRFGSYGID